MRRGAYFEPQATVYSGRHTGARGWELAEPSSLGHRVAFEASSLLCSALPPSNPTCLSLGSTPLLTRPLPLDVPHTRGLSTHGLHMLLN